MVLHPQNRVLPAQPLQLFGLLAGGKGVDYLIQIAVHDLFQIMDGQADAVVGAAILWEVVGANLLAAVAGAHLPLTLGVYGILLFLLLLCKEAAAQDLQRLILVLELTALVLALHHRTCGDMGHTDGAGGLVDVLTARTGGAEGVNAQVLHIPDTAIRCGCYYLHLCMVRYKGDVSTAAAAYHSGWGTVDQLLQIEEHSADGETLQGFPYNQMHHYVNKITACYQTYQRLYAGQ